MIKRKMHNFIVKVKYMILYVKECWYSGKRMALFTNKENLKECVDTAQRYAKRNLDNKYQLVEQISTGYLYIWKLEES